MYYVLFNSPLKKCQYKVKALFKRVVGQLIFRQKCFFMSYKSPDGVVLFYFLKKVFYKDLDIQ